MGTKPNKDTRKAADYGNVKSMDKPKGILDVKDNRQCKRAGMNDAKWTKK